MDTFHTTFVKLRAPDWAPLFSHQSLLAISECSRAEKHQEVTLKVNTLSSLAQSLFSNDCVSNNKKFSINLTYVILLQI